MDNVTQGLIVLGSFTLLSMLFPLLIRTIFKAPKNKKNLAKLLAN